MSERYYDSPGPGHSLLYQDWGASNGRLREWSR
jgi:hypothetical protein